MTLTCPRQVPALALTWVEWTSLVLEALKLKELQRTSEHVLQFRAVLWHLGTPPKMETNSVYTRLALDMYSQPHSLAILAAIVAQVRGPNPRQGLAQHTALRHQYLTFQHCSNGIAPFALIVHDDPSSAHDRGTGDDRLSFDSLPWK